MEDLKNESLKLPQNIKHLPRRLQEKILRESELTNTEQPSLSCVQQKCECNSSDVNDEVKTRTHVEGDTVGKQDKKCKNIRSRSQGKGTPNTSMLFSRQKNESCNTYQSDFDQQTNNLRKILQLSPYIQVQGDISRKDKTRPYSEDNCVDFDCTKMVTDKENRQKHTLSTRSNSLENLRISNHAEIDNLDRVFDSSNITNDFKISEIENVKLHQSRNPRNVDKKTSITSIFSNTDNCSINKIGKKRFPNLLEVNHVRPAWFDIIYDMKEHSYRRDLIKSLVELDRKMHLLLDDDIFLQKWELFIQLQKNMQDIFLKILRKDLKFCCKENVELYFWKILYHNVIEILKKKLQKQEFEIDDELVKNRILETINSGLKFYQKALKLLQIEYNFDLQSLLNTYSHCRKKSQKFLPLAIVSSQKILINLGDLFRYKELINKTQNYDCARQYYLNAQKLLPTNGIPYNQLALLAIYSKKKFDAVYYHMRSLVASNPIHSAKESLKVLFDELRKKHDENIKKCEVLKPVIQQEENKYSVTPASLRREIWNHPNGSRRLHRMPSLNLNSKGNSELNNLAKLNSIELSKKFTSSFLYIHGKLFAGVGLENFYSSTLKMLMEFRSLLCHKPLIYSRERLIQIIALNIFSIDFNNKDDVGNLRKEIRNYAFMLGFLMFGIIVHRTLQLIKEHFQSEDINTVSILKLEDENVGENILNENSDRQNYLELNGDVNVLLSAVKVWCDWMRVNVDIWKTAFTLQHEGLTQCQKEMDSWGIFAQLISVLGNIDINSNLLTTISDDEVVPVILEEDLLLDGFSSLVFNTDERLYCKSTHHEAAQCTLRLQKIFEFGSKFLCETIPPIFKKVVRADKKFHLIVSLTDSLKTESEEENCEKFEEISENVEDINRQFLDISLTSDKNTNDNPEITELIKRKFELEKKHKMQEKYQQKLQHILTNSRIPLHIEVHPKYLVPDTNCFIDFLEELKVVAKSEYFLLMIPLVVVNELEGLSKGIRNPTDILSSSNLNTERNEHLIKVAKISKQALEFIRSKNTAIRCVTTKGSVLISSVFTLEDNNNEQTSNDDKILTTALSLCKSNAEQYDGNILYIKTQVILLTTDRNLRVKALSRNLIVSQLPRFLEWAGLKVESRSSSSF